jgi:2-hydroxychromene-2-carboxylate isomerase
VAEIDWYFDVISPFSYLQCERLSAFTDAHTVRPHAVLFAGLLNYWEHKGPAEIPAKRQFTSRYVTWYARRRGIPLRLPLAHPYSSRIESAIRSFKNLVAEPL